MTPQQQRLIIVIPVYQATLKPEEQAALANNLHRLAAWPAVFIKPEGLDISTLRQQFPQVDELSVSGEWLGTRRGIAGYNEMMMSPDFYALFLRYEYMLICHVDAWVFRDDLDRFLRLGLDHIAAPWPMRPRYGRFPLKQYLQLKLWLKPRRRILHCQMFGRVGNGGFSLRRVSAFHDACLRHAEEIAFFNAKQHPLYNEDLFWALVPTELKVADVLLALTFSFDLKPRLCYQLNAEQLPMACHGFNKPMRTAFWRPFIKAL